MVEFPVLTCKQGTNADLFPGVLQMYLNGTDVLDMTYGRGVFWKHVDTSGLRLVRNDIDNDLGNTTADFREMPFTNMSFDLVILDPPYASRSGSPIKSSIDRGYNNRKRVRELGIFGTEAVMEYYGAGMLEAYRLLRQGGILVVKCMDEIMSGKQQWNHITLLQMGRRMMIDEDLFVLHQNGVPTMRHPYQLHARKNHSYFLVFRRISPQ